MGDLTSLGLTELAEAQDEKVRDINENFEKVSESIHNQRVIATADADVELTQTQHQRSGWLKFTGALTANRTITILGSAHRWIIENACDGGFHLTITQGGSPGAIPVIVVQGERALVMCDGLDSFKGASNIDSFGGMIVAPGAKTYVLDQSAGFEYDILSLTAQNASGDVTVSIQIDGVTVTGIGSIQIGTAEIASLATALNRVSIGSRVTLVAGGVGSPTPLDFGFTVLRGAV